MDSELLRRACERAKMEFLPWDDGKSWVVCRAQGGLVLNLSLTREPDRSVLFSYVADILVGMVRERGLSAVRALEKALVELDGATCVTANPAQRITAAMETLG